MFLIVAKWKDNSDSIFLVGNDPDNRRLPNWEEVFTKLDTIASPADAQIQFARISRDFILLREEETQEFSLDDPIACSSLKSLKLAGDAHVQWYDLLLRSSEASNEPPLNLDYENGNEDEPEF